jgi:hypothetical protein
MTPSALRIGTVSSLLLIGCALFTGCALQTTAAPGPEAAVALTGKVYGGQNPISGAKVYLLAADETGYGHASDSLLVPALTGNAADSIGSYVVTDSIGSFAFNTFSAGVPVYDYVCPTAATQVYVYVSGGDSGSGSPNSHIGLMTALGSCGSLSSATYVAVNEVTTVAAAYALSGFATDATHIASASTPLSIKGLQNAFLNAGQLVNGTTETSFGAARATTPNGNGTVDQQQIYTLANILAACVNTNGVETGPSNATACYTLVQNATSGGTSPVVPSETATAAINIAHNPGANVATLAPLSTKTSPFPQTSVIPNDFTIGISYDASFLNPGNVADSVGQIAIDASGNAWFGYSFDNDGIAAYSSTGVVASGAPFTGGGQLGFPGGIAIDRLGSIWVTNAGGTGVIKFSSDGSTATTVTGGTSPAIEAQNVVIDASGNVWADNYAGATGTVLTKINSPGFTTSSSFPNTGFDNTQTFTGFAFDDSGNLWAGQQLDIAEIKGDGTSYSGSPYLLLNGTTQASGVAVDANGATWIGSAAGDGGGTPDLLKSTGSGVAEAQVEYNGGGLSIGVGLAIDGAGHVWVANADSGLSEFSNAGVALSPTGFTGGQLAGPTGIAVDGSGDVWAVNERIDDYGERVDWGGGAGGDADRGGAGDAVYAGVEAVTAGSRE